MVELSIVIPCYNEGDNIIPLFKKIEAILVNKPDLEIIIVDNGSTDNTKKNILNSKLYMNHKINVFNIEENIGYGHGIMSGVKVASGNFIGWCHADLQTDPEDVYNAFTKYKTRLNNEKIIIKGTRSNRSFFDNIFTFGMSIFASIILQKIVYDINAQPKIFSKSFLIHLSDYPYDFSLDLYLLIIAKINKYKIINYKVRIKERLHGEAKGGGTLIGKIKLIKRTIIYIFKLRKKLWNL
jgi:polyisoprenyl-phosphate glycosyltransferase